MPQKNGSMRQGALPEIAGETKEEKQTSILVLDTLDFSQKKVKQGKNSPKTIDLDELRLKGLKNLATEIKKHIPTFNPKLPTVTKSSSEQAMIDLYKVYDSMTVLEIPQRMAV
ncbi:MAG: hypothetical protein H0U75_10905 [Legionella sp.]|nr:hypothetical protein [Legionella sp.]